MSKHNYTNILTYLYNYEHCHNPFSDSTNFFPLIYRYPKNDFITEESE